jgi:hypothetical protein
VKRRDFITLLGGGGGVAAWGEGAAACDAGDRISEPSSETQATLQLVAFRRGLNDEGFRERQNVAMEIQGRAKGVESPQTTMQGGK